MECGVWHLMELKWTKQRKIEIEISAENAATQAMLASQQGSFY